MRGNLGFAIVATVGALQGNHVNSQTEFLDQRKRLVVQSLQLRELLCSQPRRRGLSAECDQLLNREDLDRIRKALTDLRPDEREVFLLRQNSDLTYDEIADKRRAPVGTVKTQMRAALQKLRAVLGHD